MKKFALTFIYLAVLQYTSFCFAQADISFSAHENIRKFYDRIELAVKDSNIFTIESMIRYPLLVIDSKGQKYEIKDRVGFNDNFLSIFDERVKSAIKCQKFEALMENSGGIMFSNGTLWADVAPNANKLEIITVNQNAANTVKCDG